MVACSSLLGWGVWRRYVPRLRSPTRRKGSTITRLSAGWSTRGSKSDSCRSSVPTGSGPRSRTNLPPCIPASNARSLNRLYTLRSSEQRSKSAQLCQDETHRMAILSRDQSFEAFLSSGLTFVPFQTQQTNIFQHH